MKKKIIGIFVCMLLIVTAISAVGIVNVDNYIDVKDVASSSFDSVGKTLSVPAVNVDKNIDVEDGACSCFDSVGKTLSVPGDIIWQWDLFQITSDELCLGVEYDGTDFWVTGGNSIGADPNKLYQIDNTGGSCITFDQPPHSVGYGWRDLAFDGTYLYASSNEQIDRISGGTWTSDWVSGPFNPTRALAYDPVTGHFWGANWQSDIVEFSADFVTHTIIEHRRYPNDKNIYGLAWDDTCLGGPFLWVYSQDEVSPGGPQVLISQYDPSLSGYTSITYIGANNDPTDIAGGACFIDNWGGIPIFVGLTQSTLGRDILFGMEACQCCIKIERIYTQKYRVKVDIKNDCGITLNNIAWKMDFDDTAGSPFKVLFGGPNYVRTGTIASLAPGNTATIPTPAWLPVIVRGQAYFDLTVTIDSPSVPCTAQKTVQGCVGLHIFP